MDGDPDARTNVHGIAERKARRDAGRCVACLSRRVQRCEDVGLKRRLTDAPTAVAERQVHAAFKAAETGRKLYVMDVDAAEQLTCLCGRGHGGSREKQRTQ